MLKVLLQKTDNAAEADTEEHAQGSVVLSYLSNPVAVKTLNPTLSLRLQL